VVKASGKVVLGVRESSPPMAYMLGANEKYVGYHVRNVAASTGTTAVQLLRKRERAQNVTIKTMLVK
jgi:hypothetical protein